MWKILRSGMQMLSWPQSFWMLRVSLATSSVSRPPRLWNSTAAVARPRTGLSGALEAGTDTLSRASSTLSLSRMFGYNVCMYEWFKFSQPKRK